jgi:serine O-acetyltransferase
MPSRDAIAKLMDDLRAVLFPGHFGAPDLAPASLRAYVGARLDQVQISLTEQVRRGLAFVCDHGRWNGSAGDPDDRTTADCPLCEKDAADITDRVVETLPAIRRLLEEDVRAAYEGDPASRFVDETLLCYPGVAAIIQHRIAHQLHKLSVPLIPRIVSELAHASTGIDIHPGAVIGARFFIDHGTGVVIGETASIGQRVRIYQGVTLGARSFPSNDLGQPIKGLPRHPMVEDDVVIYAGATILGRIVIGRGATIGGNVWLTRSVPPGTHITQAQGSQTTFEGGSGI